MENLFIIQLIASFIAGGAMIAFMSLLAERTSSRISGIIVSLPSTIAIGSVFLSWTLGPEAIREALIVLPISVGFSMMFAIFWLYTSKIKLKKSIAVPISFLAATGGWLAFNLGVSQFPIPPIWVGALIYLSFVAIGYYLITYLPHIKGQGKKIEYSWLQKITRMLIAGSIITFAVYISKTAGPLWGGIFAGFPATYCSTLLILHSHYDSQFLFRTFKSAPVGQINSLIFLIVAYFSFPAFGTILGLITAYIAALIPLLILAKKPRP